MNGSNIIKLLAFFVVVFVFIGLSLFAESKSQNFKLFTDGLDSFGGRASSTNFSERIGSGGQAGVVGVSEGTNLHALQGYVNTAAFEHGDANADGNVDIIDAVYLVNYVFKDGPMPIPLETGDVDCNNIGNVTDVVYLVNYLFRDGATPCNL